MTDRQEDQKSLTIEEFSGMSADDKLRAFTSLPIPAQKLLVGMSAFASTVRSEMAEAVSKLAPEEFDEAKQALSQTPFFAEVEGRLKIADPMKDFVNVDLRKIWEEQRKSEGLEKKD